MSKVLLLVLSILISSSQVIRSQNSIQEKTQLLEQKVESTNGRQKLNAYINLLNYLTLTQPLEVLKISEKGLQLSRTLGDRRSEALIILSKGAAYSKLNRPNDALSYYQSAYKIAVDISDSLIISKVLIKSGAAKISNGRIDTAIEDFIKAENISLKINDKYSVIDAINYLGISYYLIDNYTKSIKFSSEAIKLSEEINYKEGFALAFEHLTIVKIKQEKFDEALNFNSKAVVLRKELDDLPSLAGGYYNYAVIYNMLNDFDKAANYTKKSIEIRNNIGNINGVGSNYLTLGRIYLRSNQVDSALVYLGKAYDIKIGTGDTRTTTSIVSSLSDVYEKKKDFPNAYKYLKLFKIYNDSIAGDEAKRISSKILAQQEFVRKESEIKHLQEVNTYQNNIQLFLLAIILLSLILIAVLIIFYLKNRKINKALVTKNQELISLNNDRERFFKIITHDLRSPFHPIIGYSDMLINSSDEISKAELKELATVINISTKKIFELLNNLLEWLGLNTQKMVFRPENFEIDDEINNTLILFKTNLDFKKLSISRSLENNISVYADRSMIGIILRNVISNAIKFSNENGVINISSNNNNRLIDITISDQGIGIPPEQLSLLFTTKLKSTIGTGLENGTGLGLILCKEMAERNNGKISIHSTLNVGTTVTLSLPKSVFS